MEINTQKTLNKRLLIPMLIALVGAILMTTAVFMPYSVAIGDRAEYIEKYPDEVVFDEISLTAKDMMSISMVKYAHIYNTLSESYWGSKDAGIFSVVIVSLIGGFSLLAVLFSAVKKPIAIIIFDVLAFAVFCIQNLDFTERGVIPSSSYDWGIGYYVFFGAAAVALIGAVWMLVKKIIIKRQLKTADNAQ